MKSPWPCGLLLLATVAFGIVSGYSGPDLPPGPYCGAHKDMCCTGREDRCSAPILGTLCYCDDFCNRTIGHDDCCPDYFIVCHGAEPPVIAQTQCLYNDKYMNFHEKTTDNCNECECVSDGDKLSVECQDDICMVEQDLIEEINGDYDVTWKAKRHEPFWGHKLSEGLQLRLGTLTPHKTTLNMYPVNLFYDPRDLKSSFNAKDEWGSVIADIKDQGWCGSSWAISTADVAADRYAVMSKGLETPSLSAQQLISCNNQGQRSCHGGRLDVAWQFFRKYGLVTEECFPYTGDERQCTLPQRGTLEKSGCGPPRSPNARKVRYSVSPPSRVGSEQDIMYEITESGPVQATMKVYQDFFVYESGIYKKSRSARDDLFGYHSVRIVGWGEENGVKYWTVANSWGKNWGEDGYFRIVRGENECEIEAFVISVLAQTSKNEAGVFGG